jgi:serine/threonine protein kinase
VSESDSSSALRDEVQQALAPDYALERELGRGGMSAVLLALDRPVAVRCSHRNTPREWFLRETRTVAAFSHPNVVAVHAVEERGGVLCFVMGSVEGETLTQSVRRAARSALFTSAEGYSRPRTAPRAMATMRMV